MEKPFSAHNISMLIQDIILKNGWCYSIPGLLKMLKRPIFSYSEIGYISAVSSWIIFLSQSFTHCLQMRLSLCLNSSLLWGLMFVLFQARSFLLTKDKDEEGNECECQSHWNRRKSWGQTLSHETLHLQGGMWDNSEHAPMTHVKNDLLEPVCMGGGIQHHPPTSQLWKQNFILTLRGGVEIGDNKASEGRNYSLVLIVGLQEGGWR